MTTMMGSRPSTNQRLSFREAVLVVWIGLASACFSDDQKKEEEPDSPQAISFYKDIRPIFQANCHGCHQPAKRGGKYVMTQYDALLKGGESGDAAIVPGKPDDSGLMALIEPEGAMAEMPKNQPALSKKDRELIRRWIEQGAKDDSPKSTRQRYDQDNPPVYRQPPVITSIAFHPKGDLLAISAYHEVILRSGDGKKLVGRLVGMSERIEKIAFSPDGSKLAVAGGLPGRIGELQIWDVKTRKLILSKVQGYDTLYGVSWSGDGKKVSFGCPDNTIRAIDAASGKQVLFNGAHNDWVLDTVFSSKSDHLITVSRDMSMKLIKVDTQRFVDNITSITPGALKGGLHSVTRHPTKDELLAGGSDGVPKVYRMIREKARRIGDDFNLIRAYSAMPGRLFSVAFNSDGSKIVAGSSLNNTGEVRVYNAADAKQIARVEFKQGGIFAVAYHPKMDQIAAGGFEGRVSIINVMDGKTLESFFPVPLTTETAKKD